MKQEDYELYNKICSVKNTLKEQFYDYTNGRKPTICSDDALPLLVKYKLTSLKDMSWIVNTF